MLRLVLGALAAAAVGALACVVVLAATGGSGEDLTGFGVIAFVTTLVLALVVYTPGLALIRQRNWSRGRTILFAATVLNAPAYGILLHGLWKGGMFGGWTEVALFAGAYIVAAFVFVQIAVDTQG
jgi:hypothetical protein